MPVGMDMGQTESRAFEAPPEAAALRPFGWGELCARLVAAQDLRRIQAQGTLRAGPHAGSFHQGAAALLGSAEAGWQNVEAVGQEPVNPTSSTNGKGNQGTPVGDSETSLIERQTRQSYENRHD